MYEDNMGALQLSSTTAFSSRTKRSCTRYHFLGELVASNKVIVSHVKTTDQLTDIFTKFLDYPKFKVILDKVINFASWATLQDHQHLNHHVYWGPCVCYFIVLVCAVCSTICLFQTLCSYTRISSLRYSRFLPGIHSDGSFWSIFFEWLYFRIILATLTTIAIPRCNEGVGMSGDVGRSLGLLFTVVSCLRFKFILLLLLFMRFAITYAAILFR